MTDTAKPAQGKVLISLPKEVGADLDVLGEQVTEVVQRETGVPISLTRGQVVQAIVKQAMDRMDAAYDQAEGEPEAAA